MGSNSFEYLKSLSVGKFVRRESPLYDPTDWSLVAVGLFVEKLEWIKLENFHSCKMQHIYIYISSNIKCRSIFALKRKSNFSPNHGWRSPIGRSAFDYSSNNHEMTAFSAGWVGK